MDSKFIFAAEKRIEVLVIRFHVRVPSTGSILTYSEHDRVATSFLSHTVTGYRQIVKLRNVH